eukprot:m.8940 g.8940  ORF g.8940 m.8940 type:complete len:107 (+) comp3980_c0_seq1:109-429(+)
MGDGKTIKERLQERKASEFPAKVDDQSHGSNIKERLRQRRGLTKTTSDVEGIESNTLKNANNEYRSHEDNQSNKSSVCDFITILGLSVAIPLYLWLEYLEYYGKDC